MAASTSSSTSPPGGGLAAFHWTPQPAAAALVRELLDDLLRRCPEVTALANRMRAETATRFSDWVDTLVVPGSPALGDRLRASGFTLARRRGADTCFVHEAAIFPDIVMVPENRSRVAIAVESVADFCAAHAIDASTIEGVPHAPFRRVKVVSGDWVELWVVERHGYDGFQIADLDPRYALQTARTLEAFRSRRRIFAGDEESFDFAEDLVTKAVIAVGKDMACDLFFAAEREYWQRRNRAARVQKERQDALGLGWANHDHHTYRSSRHCFKRLIAILESLGMVCRERFYPGGTAGWGAQILEHPVTGIVVFADVDMSPDELKNDFAHDGLPSRRQLGTVGLWCALHGEAFNEAGMHHLECTFDHAALTAQLATAGVGMMAPFTDFPYLRQAFSEGERWTVRRERVMPLLAAEQIDPKQARVFLDEGVIGSHLENLERNDGFKGFNQSGVDAIIAATDPRRA
ncbi:MAG: hypothetical protein H0W83_02550 [Planctomycetes bacterium]|nr:hypothetical protein [Planctomycetota bacterium]